MKILRLAVFIIMLLLVTAAFIFFGQLTSTVSAPFWDELENMQASEASSAENSVTQTGELPGASGETDDETDDGVPFLPDNEASAENASASGNAAPGKLPGELTVSDTAAADSITPSPPHDDVVLPDKDAYTKTTIDAFFIHKGSLLLINHNNKFESPAHPDYVLVSSFKTSSYRLSDSKMELSYSIMEPLNTMMDAYYDETGQNNVTIVSAYRDFDKQQAVLNDYIARYGKAEAARLASQPGYSEHHSGMAFDLGVYSGGSVRTFQGTSAHRWFVQNAWKYGFILRYPPDKTDITKTASEPWHFRYVGDVHAYIISENGWCLEEYIEFITQHPPLDSYRVIYGADVYEIFFTRETEFDLHKGCSYTISGNNSDGFIVTITWPHDIFRDAVAKGTIEAVDHGDNAP